MLFRRLFTIWFMLFTLASSVAWAVGEHGDHGHLNTVLESGSDHDEPLPWSQDGCSDHCGHATAHALGLIAFSTGMAVIPLPDNVFVSEATPRSLSLSPPFHPPIA